MEQLSREWFAARCGKVTASRVSDVMAKGKGVTRRNYMASLIAETLTGETAPTFTGPKLERGKEVEAQARAAYEFFRDATIEDADFFPHPTIENCGASPDGLVGEDGSVEIKCPDTATHIDTRLGKTTPKAYRDQMQLQMACTGRKWCDYVSYDPRMPEHLSLFCHRVERDDKAIAEMEVAIIEFQKEMAEKIQDLENK